MYTSLPHRFGPAWFPLLAALLGLAACDGDSGPGTPPPGSDLPLVEVVPTAGIEDLRDPAALRGVFFSGSRLHVVVSYGGGCMDHGFRAIASDSFGESEPPQLLIYLQHVDPGDPCDAIITKELVFDAGPIVDLFRLYYGNAGTFIANIMNKESGNDFKTLRSTFTFEDRYRTPRESAEAEAAAVLIGGTLTAPDWLYETIRLDFAVIRDKFAGSWPKLESIHFWPPWPMTELLLRVDAATGAAIREGTYHAWDELNDRYGAWLVQGPFGDGDQMLLRFAGLLHPGRLGEQYIQLPGVLASQPLPPPVFLDAGSGPIIAPELAYPRLEGEVATYLFFGYGEANFPTYWYFRDEGATPELVGIWTPGAEDFPPTWWEEAQKNILLYSEWTTCCVVEK